MWPNVPPKGQLQRGSISLSLMPADSAKPGEAPAANSYYDAKTDKRVAVHTVQNVGSKTFYRCGEQWVDGKLTKDQQQNPVKIERFSDDFFKLIAKHKELTPYLSFDDPVVIEVDGQAYSF